MSISGNHDLRRYVLPSETVVLATRRHWASLLEPIATTVAVFLAVAGIVFVAPPDLQPVVGWLWFGWLYTLGRLGFRWFEWRHEWFVSTDKRLLLLYGLVIHKVAMMPLTKVTDMGYSRTPLGQLLGYGRFVMESAGQDQALRQVDYVPHPDATYRTLCAEIFRPAGGRPGPDGGARPPAPGGLAPGGAAQLPVVIVPGRPDQTDPRPTTQPIAVVGRSGAAAQPGTGFVPPAVTPGLPGTPGWPAGPAGAAATPAGPGTAGSAVPPWESPRDWKRPRPYDPDPH
ncbi:PH domain-containing protein [Xylanimonas protaetiae]|uniref:PH domain-containing protein n=1 Tax=Xylanimonas protaetiae TaxID=2509457 RepID=A0A4P6F1V4_9MICO|nr:PH domain-containing protein [Xylanimonas protaetiae]QAY68663.1 PH domain-containing protein [Xylanimonas protaetiae]